MAHVYDILSEKGHEVHSVPEDSTVLDATRLMNQHRIGALLVMRGPNLAGMFTERDVLTRVVAERKDPSTTQVGQVMTRQVLCCSPDTSILEARGVMRKKRIRHLPVIGRDGKIVGMISMGDLNAWSLADGEATIHYMSEYIYGRA